MAHEFAQEPYLRESRIPHGYDWASLRARTGEPLEAHYLATLHKLGEQAGMLGAIFFKAQNKIQDPAKLARLVQMIDAENWVGMDTDAKGDLYEGLLQKNAEDTKSGAGQYFTPRALIQAIVACMRPEPMKTIADPACGTGGFFLAANEWLTGTGEWIHRHCDWLGHEAQRLTRTQKAFLRDETFHGNEIVAATPPPMPDEPLPAQHRRAGRRALGRARGCADRRPARLRRLLQPGEPPRTQGNRALPLLRL